MNTWLISGCSNGLGRCWTESVIHEYGDRVIGITRSVEAAQEMTALYPEHFIPCIADVRDEEYLARILPQLAKDFGIPSRVVTSAGYAQFGTLEDLSTEQLRQQFATNVEGTLNVIKPVLPLMRQLDEARILLVSSMSGVACWPLLGAYQMSKHAIEAMGQTLRHELEGTSIQVGVIQPGPYRTGWATTSAQRQPIGSEYDGEALKKRATCGFNIEDPKASLPYFWRMFNTPEMPEMLATSAEFVDLICAQAEEKVKKWRASLA
ncbi:SDR family oxidoreductase [Pantoea agglomerans]|uniref:SDR family NAD(P)-dependent oxidoreductase n=1 Tax=Enterobacter agglomerans TaxID=549 RepID=A0A7X2MLG8_ENTAG|nr:SDR family oxidoreductase [Pantoea agglomerans]MCL6413064.1 SDR family oxidoreductase [Pantoea agglomerans]MSE15338.1 SDR family NAD(P)-dependent oxidoreductase [Pantoea agglomerans]QAV47401.1 SDR family oxidoreductase [Pantoea agglomerans]QAV52068.1 SDR family oxidoreductase [Pantoea agglomerans]QGY60578.1 SDR family NAD(P)-dependent oxidoreductase [Pantoea agglomerans]